ncbi:hypothetical protein CXF85_13800 [Colwellia sp. 75C3]|uniref:lipopolysaccharide biosynthesis protein n=1 Tax=Colwellia sp. 75C3 TaxID=888425 RepID=UPI000C31FBF0|nr:oligosaccharide flippase family protein [Colwellia sp. 75C3]PKG82551.1 hypothetical protein CXF85_13800 [Colwellia sp. 75C3]
MRVLFKLLNKHSDLNLTLIDQAIVSGVNFLTGLLLARFLGLEAFGVFTMLWMVVMFVNSIQMAAISAPMMTIGVKYESQKERDEYYSGVIAQQGVFSLITFVAILVGVKLTAHFKPELNIENLALPLALAAFFFQNQDFMRRYFFCHEKTSLVLISDVISYLGQLAFILIMSAFFELSLVGVLWVIALTSAAAVVLLLSKVNIVAISLKTLLNSIQRNVHFSKWLIASALMQWTSGNYFIITAGVLLGPIAVGALKAAQNIVGVTHILFQALDNIVPIKASQALINSKSDLTAYLKKVALIGGVFVGMLCLVIGMFSSQIMSLIYGAQYADYGLVLSAYSAIYMVIFLCLPLRAGLRALEVTKPIFYAYIVMSVFSLLTAASLIVKWELIGALLGILITQLLMLVILWLAFVMPKHKEKENINA